MTQEEGAKIKGIIQGFLNDEMGNRLTKWNSNALAQTISYEIDQIVEIHKLKEEDEIKEDSEVF